MGLGNYSLFKGNTRFEDMHAAIIDLHRSMIIINKTKELSRNLLDLFISCSIVRFHTLC